MQPKLLSNYLKAFHAKCVARGRNRHSAHAISMHWGREREIMLKNGKGTHLWLWEAADGRWL